MSNQDVFKLMVYLDNSPECIQTGAGNRYLYYLFLYTVFRNRAYYGTRCIQLMTIGSGGVYLQANDGRQSDEERNEEGGNRPFIYLLGGK